MPLKIIYGKRNEGMSLKLKCKYCKKELEKKKLNRLFNFCSIKCILIYSLQKIRELETPTFE